MALGAVNFKGRKSEFLSAYSGAQGFKILSRGLGAALARLDAVRETVDAGLRLGRRILACAIT